MSYRPRNRQPRHNAPNTNSRPTDSRGHRSNPNVPRHSQLHINTPVSVVLKADQPTGRQVQGFVAEVLTSGDHPHGVKVRLTDGRVGRVQRLASAEDAASGTSDGVLRRDGEATGQAAQRAAGASRVVYEDARVDGYDYDGAAAAPGPSLEDYIVTKAPRRKKGKASTAVARDEMADAPPADEDDPGDGGGVQRANFSSAKTTCPVCHAFEGDEEAVAHHVGTHFE